MSSEATKGVEADIYGQLHPVETPKLIERALREMETELNEKLPETATVHYKQAQEKCPNICNDPDFRLLFLRCEVFNTDLAAKRYAMYWTKRFAVFGPDHAFKPLTLNDGGPLAHDKAALECGFMCVLNIKTNEKKQADSTNKQDDGKNDDKKDKDDANTESTNTTSSAVDEDVERAVLWVQPSKQDRNKYTRDSMVRAVWYFIHAALENPVTARRGLLFFSFPRHAQLRQFDRQLLNRIADSLKGALPARVSAMHICDPPTFFSVIFPVVKLLLGERLRKRILVHSGKTEKIRLRLSNYGVNVDDLPTQLGGKQTIQVQEWLNDRRARGL